MQVGSVPVQGGAGAEAGEEVIEASKSCHADCEEAEGGGVEKEGFGVDPFST